MSQPANDEFSQHLSDDEASNNEDASDTDAAPKQQQVIPQTTAISNIKLPILKKEEYDIWAMDMEHYLEYIDKGDVLDGIQNGNLRNEFQLERISEGLEKGYDRFQQLLSQLEAHGAEVSTEDANHKFLRSLPPTWSNLAMTMRTKSDVDTLSIDDLKRRSCGFANKVIYSSLPKQSEDWDLLHEDMDDDDWSLKECTAKGTHDEKKKRDSFYQHKEAGKQKKNQIGLLTMDDGIVNWGEHTEDEETNHARSEICGMDMSTCLASDTLSRHSLS
ncbi:hypothetical protein Tco_0543648 [Tanacetum coccineum]